MRWSGSLMAAAVALMLLPSAQAWIVSSPLVFCDMPNPSDCGPVEDVMELLDDPCVPDFTVGPTPPFVDLDESCFGNSAESPPSGNSTSSPASGNGTSGGP